MTLLRLTTRKLLAAGLALVALSGGATAAGVFQRGHASYYAGRYDRTTRYVAAHRTLPFGSWVRVTNTRNGRSVNVKINDRGPFIAGRIIDVSNEAAAALGMTRSGVAAVTVRVISRPRR